MKTFLTKRKARCALSSPAYQKRNHILLEMQKDLKSYYERKDAREAEKLDMAKKAGRRNKNNNILKEYVVEWLIYSEYSYFYCMFKTITII